MRRTALFLGALLAVHGALAGAAILNGCSDDQESTNIPEPFTPRSDVQLIDGLTPHHEQAIEMAELVAQKGEDPAIKAMASKMIADQQGEIQQMERIREDETGNARVPAGHKDSQMEATIAEMRQLSGADLDRRFLEEMIPHHAGAIQMTHRAIPNLDRDDLRQLAENAKRMQAREIGEMQMMLDHMQ